MGISYNTSIVRNGLVLHLDAANKKSYPGTGTTWTDLSGLGNNGTLVNGVGYNSSNKGNFTFDGVNDFISIANSSSYKVQFPMSLGIIFKIPTATSRMVSFLTDDTSDFHRGVCVQVLTSLVPSVQYGNGTMNAPGGRRNFDGTSTLELNKWYYMVATLANNLSCQIYINGVSDSTAYASGTATTLAYSTGVGTIGRKNDVTTAYSNGTISLAQVYNRALSAAEVKQNFEALRGRYGI